jgi:hypothetical protein
VRHVFRRLLEKAELRLIRIHDLAYVRVTAAPAEGVEVYVKEQL